MNPTVTVIVPTYNQGKFIDKCLDSILCQSYRNFEVIVINGSSTDKTEYIAKRYQTISNVHFTYVLTKYNNMAEKLNIGCSMAMGRFITYVASDDYWHKDFLKECVNAMYEQEADLVYTSSHQVRLEPGAKSGYDHISDLLKFQEWGGYNKLIYGNVVGCFFMFRKNMFAMLNGFAVNVPYADWDFALKGCEEGWKFHYIPKRLATYQIHKGSDSTRIDVVDKGQKRLKAMWKEVIFRLESKGKELPEYLKNMKLEIFQSGMQPKREDWHVLTKEEVQRKVAMKGAK